MNCNDKNNPLTYLSGLQFPLYLLQIGERPPADQVNVGLLGWLEFLLNHGMDEADFGLLLEVGQELVVGHNADNADNNDNNVNNENRDNIENNEHHENNINNENNNNSNHEDDINNENNGNHDNVDNLYNDDNIHNDNIDHSADNVDSENANDASPAHEVGPGVNQNVEGDKHLLRRWWDEFADSSSNSDSDNDRTDNNSDDKDPGNSSVAHEVAEEEDPLPGPSWKWSTEHDVVKEERGVKKSRQCDEFADSSDNSLDTVTVRTGENLAHISIDFELDENAGAAEGANEEVNQQVEEEGPRPESLRKRSRESDEDSDSGSSKRLRP